MWMANLSGRSFVVVSEFYLILRGQLDIGKKKSPNISELADVDEDNEETLNLWEWWRSDAVTAGHCSLQISLASKFEILYWLTVTLKKKKIVHKGSLNYYCNVIFRVIHTPFFPNQNMFRKHCQPVLGWFNVQRSTGRLNHVVQIFCTNSMYLWFSWSSPVNLLRLRSLRA